MIIYNKRFIISVRRLLSPVVDYLPMQSAIINDIRTFWMNIVFLGRKSAAQVKYCSHQRNIICCSSISSVVGEYHPA
jgi:hypothetical protein